ncbi:LysR substrate-binding domain-containing protein [Burkholderia oklahomensis]|uniref:LysR substrate-binding domain-containing protein n=1 Tax=Burkholderia oklahomensis TaxID=342113 RepID=UPI00016A9B30|nr:lysR substrate binding domain protein [Burkholderia oklahomensis C6786]AOI49861.1 LysR family transcriptional regulator [Burkholderia oklahomensis C6786]KUY47263.1 LysR family transcriptional regulator [Burkholderia oklahomensis C6786]MBI0361825.1 LysR family transcriptional regulator [Burkholderia oklahomensis]SUY28777.1 D-malate degradation protein R [Burkholderia oklahomensis]
MIRHRPTPDARRPTPDARHAGAAHCPCDASRYCSSPTEAGERLLSTVGVCYERIEAELDALSELREKPAGTIRITAHDHVVDTILWPKLAAFMHDYPDVNVEINVDYGLIDIVAERYDAGVRSGDQVAKDMIAVRIGPDMRMAVVGSPAYLSTWPRPQAPRDLAEHACVNLRLPTYGGLYAWEFVKGDQDVPMRVHGQFTFNTTPHMLKAALDGYGLAYVPEDLVIEHVAQGRLERVLEDWCPRIPGYHLYYPSRRQPSAAFALLVDALRHGG